MEPVVAGAAPAAVGKIEDSQEFKDALAKSREEHRLNLEAEYQRKQREWEAAHPKPAAPAGNGADYFEAWGERHGLPAQAGKDLVEGVVSYIAGQVLPAALKPLTQATKRSELRSQRTDLRTSNPKLAKLDDRYHSEVTKLLDPMDASLIGPDSYARALHMVIGQNIEAIEAEREKAGQEAGAGQREVAPGPEPTPDSGGGKTNKVILSAYQQQLCEEKGWDVEFFVDLIRTRARKMEANGKSKIEIRKLLGEQLGSIEF